MATILVIDDDPQFTNIMKILLQQAGHEADIAHTPTQVESYISNKSYDLILLDVFFPNKDDGLNLLIKLKANIHTDEVPVILATSMPGELFTQEPNFDIYLEKAKEFISKTDNTKKIVERITEIISDK